MALSQRIPVLLCGKTLNIGTQVAELLKPDFEVIQFIDSFDYAKSEMGNLLAGQGPKTPSSNTVGTHDYSSSRPLRAIIFGRGYPPEQVSELFGLFYGKSQRPIAWIAGDPEFKLPAAGKLPVDYARIAAENTKRAFRRWETEGGVREEIVFY